MKKIDTTAITGDIKAPFIKATHDHIKESIQDTTGNIIKGLIGSYTTGDLIVLHGCVITANVPGTSSITAGAIYYNGEIYDVDANASLITTGSDVLVWEILTKYRSGDPIKWSDGTDRDVHRVDKLELVAGVSGSGLADYNGATVKYLKSITVNTSSSLTFNTGWGGIGGNSISLRPNGDVEFNGNITITTGGTENVLTLPTWAIPVTTKRFYIADYNGTDGPSELMVLYVDLSGVLKIVKQADGTKPTNRGTLSFTVRYNIYI